MDEEEKAILEEKLIECYRLKGITFEDESLYKVKNINGNIEYVFKESIDMPVLEDLYNILGDTEKTNIEIDSKLIVADIYELRRGKYKIWNVHFHRIILR